MGISTGSIFLSTIIRSSWYCESLTEVDSNYYTELRQREIQILTSRDGLVLPMKQSLRVTFPGLYEWTILRKGVSGNEDVCEKCLYVGMCREYTVRVTWGSVWSHERVWGVCVSRTREWCDICGVEVSTYTNGGV